MLIGIRIQTQEVPSGERNQCGNRNRTLKLDPIMTMNWRKKELGPPTPFLSAFIRPVINKSTKVKAWEISFYTNFSNENCKWFTCMPHVGLRSFTRDHCTHLLYELHKSCAYSRDMKKAICNFLNLVKIDTYPLQHSYLPANLYFMIPGIISKNANKVRTGNENLTTQYKLNST